ncbi:tryptophan synthase subunit alpha [Pseudidiomarina insulisalsae]|uniref:Tryptophan synthase alpha chain n=1 Tax=Pseudidiomarina insulisalsae TaxID=575789 RepID=A0A432YC63_9GAMM|nr:tryptophan synthase subunit alpha [Pseudidiomarina insulisalsae]RUO58595.1 tryptophan synthase subunit alpha [Pseudidiomarina insulisalsae]
MSRYEAMFERLEAADQGAFVPFVTLGDPNPQQSLEVIEALVAGGADALELGFPFSDPVADGPTIQKAAIRALGAGTKIADCFAILRKVRERHPDLPIGLLVYANLVASSGLERFYERCAEAGVDSVLIADVPARESQPFIAAAKEHGIAPIFIAPPDANAERLQRIAELSEGYVYLLSRAGVTGAETGMQRPAKAVIDALREANSAPPLLGFGIARPEHVEAALAAGAAGAISGSAVVNLIAKHHQQPEQLNEALSSFVRQMKTATNNRAALLQQSDS